MKTATINLLAVVVMALPIASYAQSPDTVTRAQVRAELVQLENAGYYPRANDPHYPDDIQAAEAKIAASKATASLSTNGVGGSPVDSSASGNRANAVEETAVYGDAG
jgi:hypothetical protein